MLVIKTKKIISKDVFMYRKGEKMELSKNELIEIKGGAIKYGIYIAIGAAVTFIIGLVDGFLRPLKCNR